jgi:thiol-disulfide isomerase/thioredoxin
MTSRILAALCLLTASASPALEPGEKSRPVPLTLASGETIQLPDTARRKLPEVIVFILPDCPIANAFQPELNRLSEQFATAGVRFTLIHVDPSTTSDAALAHQKDFGIQSLVALDPKRKLVKALGATVTPEAFLFASDGSLAYRGRINDWYQVLGRRTRTPKNHDLREAITAVLQGKKVLQPKTEAIGCFIE